MFFGFVFLTTSFFTSIFSISMGFLAATLEMGYFQFMFDIEKSSKTDLFLRFCVYLAISIGGLIVNFNFGFVLLLCALYGVLTVSGYVLALFLFLFQCLTQPSLFSGWPMALSLLELWRPQMQVRSNTDRQRHRFDNLARFSWRVSMLITGIKAHNSVEIMQWGVSIINNWTVFLRTYLYNF